MIVKKSQRKRHENADTCVVYEYEHKDENIDVALALIEGRYPEKGVCLNEICKEILFVVEGNGIIEIDGEKIELEEGDSVLIQPNQKYYFEGKLKIIISCSPSWKPEQYKVFE